MLSDETLFSFGSGVQCQICITLVGISQSLIGEGRQAVIDACNTACDATIIFSAPCKQLVSTAIDELLRLLRLHLPANEICKQLGLCGSKHTALFNVIDAGTTFLPVVPRVSILQAVDGPVLGVQGIMALQIQDLAGLLAQVCLREDTGIVWAAKYGLLANTRTCGSPQCHADLMSMIDDGSLRTEGKVVSV